MYSAPGMNEVLREANTVTVTDHRELVATLERSMIDTEERTVPVTISTAAALPGPSGMLEVLRHDSDSIDFSRAENGLPLQVAHDSRTLPVGRVERLHLVGSKLRGVARFSRSARGSEAWQDVVDGILCDVSIGAQVARNSWLQEGETLFATRWTPYEVSLVASGADPGAGINREHEKMNEPTNGTGGTGNAENTGEAIAALFAGLDGEQWLTMERDALRAGDSVDQVRTRVLDALKADAAPRTSRDTVDIVAGADSMEKWTDQCERALDVKLGLRKYDRTEMQSNELSGMTFREMARDYLRQRGLSSTGLNAEKLISRALSVPALVRSNFAHSTSDFANLLGSSAEKALSAGYTEAPETYAAWTRNVNMANFRQHTFTNLSLFGDLSQVRQLEEYKSGTFSDRAETATLATYGKLFGIARQALINDDLNAMVDVPRKMGRAAARQVGDLVYSIITTDAVLSDQAGATLFNTTDGTLAASATVIDTANMSIARTALRTRTDPSGATLNVQPAYLLVPAAIETVAQVFLATAQAPGGSNNDVNVFANSMQLVVEPRLDADDVNAWYVMGAPGGEVETVVVGWLDGRQEPFLEQEEGFTVDGMRYKVRIDCTAAALDWRGMYQNAGA